MKSTLLGPRGGKGGKSWDDGSHKEMREITLVYDGCIDSIEVTYISENGTIIDKKHGGKVGNYTAKVSFLYHAMFYTYASYDIYT